jgi:hypothetical protein
VTAVIKIVAGGGGKFSPSMPFALACGNWGIRKPPAMTRPAIERCIYVFIVALILTFIWTVTKVLAMLGWF